MKIAVKLAFDEQGALLFLNTLARWNCRLLHADKSLPLLYDSHVVYRQEDDETWCDIYNALLQGHEDCDGLAAWRCGEILRYGWRAIRHGDPGFQAAASLRPTRIRAEVILRTRVPRGRVGLYHCIAKFWIGGKSYIDDPSARLGMYANRIDPIVLRRWEAMEQRRYRRRPKDGTRRAA